MKPRPMESRIVGALRLAPMTCADLARCLSVSVGGVRHAMTNLSMSGDVVVSSRRRAGNGHPWWVYRLRDLA